MQYYDVIDFFKNIDINKTSASKEYDISHYRYFLDKGFPFQPYFCNSCHGILMMSVNLNDIAILNRSSVDYLCIINGISKSDAVNLLQNANLIEGRGIL